MSKHRSREQREHWTHLRERVFKRDQHECQRCGFQVDPSIATNALVCHRFTEEHFGQELMADCETWCRRCHIDDWDAKRKKQQDVGPRREKPNSKKKKRTRTLGEKKAKQKRRQERIEARWQWDHSISRPKEHAMRENIPRISPEKRQAILDRLAEKTLAEKKKRGIIRRPTPHLTTPKAA